MSDPVPPSVSLIPSPAELRRRLAVALREVAILRRLIRVAEDAARDPALGVTERPEHRGVRHA